MHLKSWPLNPRPVKNTIYCLILVTRSLAFASISTGSVNETFNYAIIGGGATGLSLAVRLSEDPSKTVVVLEAGLTGFGNPNITDFRLNRGNFGTANDWQFMTVPQADAGNRPQAQIQARVLGGGSAINSGMYLRGNMLEYDALETLGAKGWNWDSMFSAVQKSEHFFLPSQQETDALGLTYNPAFHGFAGPIALLIQAQNVSKFFKDYALPTLQALGHEINFDPNGGRHNGASWDYLIQVLDHTRFQDTVAAKPVSSGHCPDFCFDTDLPVAGRTNLVLKTSSHVSKIVWAYKKARSSGMLSATGVEYIALNEAGETTGIHIVKARNVILSGSALNTPKILEHSGVGDRSVLERLLTQFNFEAGNAIRSAIIDVEPFDKFLSPTDLERSRKLLSDSARPPGLSTRQFNIMKEFIMNTDIPQMEFAWVRHRNDFSSRTAT
ncbi:hypothetical protein H0H87_003336 [Tephrocybe sp. NHM501043]|nr:hypothetical protein H0H87_003336 [Tephrocybe sp. NHM501043]